MRVAVVDAPIDVSRDQGCHDSDDVGFTRSFDQQEWRVSWGRVCRSSVETVSRNHMGKNRKNDAEFCYSMNRRLKLSAGYRSLFIDMEYTKRKYHTDESVGLQEVVTIAT